MPNLDREAPSQRGFLDLFSMEIMFNRKSIWAWAVLVFGIGASAMVWRQMDLNLEEHMRADFQRAIFQARHTFEKRMGAYEVALRGAAALAATKPDLSREDWRRYAVALDLGKNHPALQAIAWAPVVARADLNRHVLAMRDAGLPDYRVFPDSGNAELTPVALIEPFAGRNLRALGFDLSSDAIRREAMANARSTGLPSLTRILTLSTEDVQQPRPGVTLYVPAHAHQGAGRSPALKGYVVGAFRIAEFMQSVLVELAPHMRVQVFESQNAEKPVFDNLTDARLDYEATHVATASLALYGQTWKMVYSFYPQGVEFYRREVSHAHYILLAGVAITLLLFLFLLSQGMLKERASELAARMTSALRESEQRWQFALEGSGDGVVDWNLSTGDIFFSRRASEMLGFSQAEMPRTQSYGEWLDKIHPEDRAAARGAFERLKQDHSAGIEVEFRLLCKDATYLWVLVRAKAVEVNANGEPSRIIGVRTDITQRRGQLEQLRLAAKVLESSSEGIMITDSQQHIVMVNPAFSRVTGYSLDEAITATPHLLASGRHDAGFYQSMWTAIRASGFWQGEIWNRRKDGTVYPEWLTVNHVLDEHGKVGHYVGIFSDISARKSTEARIEQLAHFDPLTQLPNRVLLHDRMEQAITATRRAGNCMAVMFLDLDHFKTINDTLGHHWGDKLLTFASQRLRGSVREGDTVARQGGDEFIIVLPNLHDADAAAAIAQKLVAVMSHPYELNGKEIAVTVSIGISALPDDAQSMDDLTKHADAAMYYAKQNGRNRFQFYTEEMSRHANSILAMETELRYAVERNQLVLHYQPQMRLADGRIIGFEALVRWRHPEKGLISPAEFIPLAESRGLILDIGDWILHEACRQNRRLQLDGGPCVPVAVNISAPQFAQPDFLDRVEHALEETDLAPRYLELELTESIVMHDVQKVIGSLQTLRKLGVRLSIDDFGTGYSSLSYLKRLPIDKLKIDQSFVRDIHVDADDAAITSTIINLARCMKLEVIAEGVETVQQLEFLRVLGCDEIQGYLYSKPLAPEQLGPFLQSVATCLPG